MKTICAIVAGLLLAGMGAVGGAAPGATKVPKGMVSINGGLFRPLFRTMKVTTVKPFCIDALPVTNEDYLRFARANPQWQRSAVKRLFADPYYLKNWAGDLEPGTNAPLNAPVTFVSWFAANAYAEWSGKRLASTAEWELAAAAGYTNADGEADAEFKRDLLAWYASPSGKLGSVGAGRPNYWGVHDLHGLIWEWVSDFNNSATSDTREDSGMNREQFCGGGSSSARDPADFAAFMRYGFRSSLKANYCVHNLGFRCAKDL